MNEIKFRAWDKEDKKMFNVMDIYYPRAASNVTRINLCGGDLKTVDNVELMQFTGLVDRNKKEIYQGDIIRFDKRCCHGIGIIQYGEYCSSCGSCGEYTDVNCIGYYIEPKCMSCTECIQIGISNNIEIEVIGNVYENPELIRYDTASIVNILSEIRNAEIQNIGEVGEKIGTLYKKIKNESKKEK